jgi:hypothetical protein
MPSPYQIPSYPTLDLWGSNIRYIDGASPTNGNGLSPSTPMNQFPNPVAPGMAYLLKRGSILTQRPQRTWIDNYIGSYGTTEDWSYQIGGFFADDNTNGLTIDGLNIRRAGNNEGGWSAVILIRERVLAQNIHIVNNDIRGLYNGAANTDYWPRYIVKGITNNFIAYNNIMGDAGGKLMYHPGANQKWVRNFMINCNRNTWGEAIYDESIEYGSGNAFTATIGSFPNLHLLGNFFDGARDYTGPREMYWKSGIAVYPTNGRSSVHEGTIIEYNTIVSTPDDLAGGAAFHFTGYKNTICRNNIIDSSLQGRREGKSLVAFPTNYVDYWNDGANYGVRNNHMIGHSAATIRTWPTNVINDLPTYGNILHNSWADFQTHGNAQGWGSDINPSDFWQKFPINFPHTTIPGITGNLNSTSYLSAVKDRLDKIKENIVYLRENRNLSVSQIEIRDLVVGDKGIQLRDKYNTDVIALHDQLSNIRSALNLPQTSFFVNPLNELITREQFVNSINNNNAALMDNLEEIKNELI